MTVRWTQALADAARQLVDEPVVTQLDEDIHHRAREYVSLNLGVEFAPHQVSYTHCLLQRLDWHNPRPSHVAFKKAWEEANA